MPSVLHGTTGPPLSAHVTRTHLLGLDELYTIALYADPPVDRARLLSAEVAKALRFQVVYEPDLRRPPIAEWYRELIPRLQPAEVAHLRGTFAALRRGDVVQIEWVPGRGTSVKANRTVVVSDASHELMLAFLDHWFGQRPVSEEIKRGCWDRHKVRPDRRKGRVCCIENGEAWGGGHVVPLMV